jgi:alpha-L-fucosidase
MRTPASVQVPVGSLEGTLPVIKLTFRGEVVIDKPLPIYDTGPIVLDEKSAEKFYSYNGRGYESPKTLYKMRWAVRTGCASMTFHTNGEGEVALVSIGSSRRVMLKDGSTEEIVIGGGRDSRDYTTRAFSEGNAVAVKDSSDRPVSSTLSEIKRPSES